MANGLVGKLDVEPDKVKPGDIIRMWKISENGSEPSYEAGGIVTKVNGIYVTLSTRHPSNKLPFWIRFLNLMRGNARTYSLSSFDNYEVHQYPPKKVSNDGHVSESDCVERGDFVSIYMPGNKLEVIAAGFVGDSKKSKATLSTRHPLRGPPLITVEEFGLIPEKQTYSLKLPHHAYKHN